ncbi:response regulator [Pseudoroseomonas globiformis]|uniref:histidine kinase n=1 Tax=Teichococcus globiformis TaxID=2307229 RepID=A0ABV7G0Q6_9PROT
MRGGVLGTLLRRLRNRPDSEHEMSFNRLGFAGVIALAMLISTTPGTNTALFVLLVLYIPLAFAVLAHILWRPAANPRRRLAALLLDCGFLSLELHLGGEPASMFFAIYLWVIFGNGFRFGLGALRAAVVASVAGFGTVMLTTPFWWEQINLSAGLLVALIILPLYAGRLIKRLSQARAEAEAASEAKSLFLAAVSHELRTPLNAIIGLGGLLRETRLDSEQADMARTMDSAAHTLLSLIEDVLDLSRIEAGRMPVHPVAFPLAGLLAELRSLLIAQCHTKGLRLTLHVTPRTPPALLADRRHLFEVLMNLAGNAVKFTEEGGVTIAIDVAPATEDHPGAAGGGLWLAAEITDTGIGIAPEAQSRIFEDFTQADSSIVNRFGGTGLGLAICRRIVRLLGGEIGVTSLPGVGSTFRFRVPVGSADAEPPAPLDQATVVVLDPDLQRRGEWLDRLSRLGVGTVRVAGESVTAGRLLAGPQDAALPPPLLLAAAGVKRPPGTDPSRCLRFAAHVLPGLPEEAARQDCLTLLSRETPGATLAQALRLALDLTSTGGRIGVSAPADAEPDGAGNHSARPLRVLVADDSAVNRRVMERILQHGGHSAVLVEDGEEALDVLENEADSFDLVLMDVNMPRMDGLETTKMFRVMALGQTHLPILALTADATDETAARCMAAGMDGHLTKPVQPKALLAAVAAGARPARQAPVPVSKLAPAATRPLPGAGGSGPGSVSHVAEHPRFRPGGMVVDASTVDTLRRLGGEDFLRELAEDFLQDAVALVEAIGDAARDGDTSRFQAEVHALRSSAANLGALAVTRLCGEWRLLERDAMMQQASLLVASGHAALESTRRALLEGPAPG